MKGKPGLSEPAVVVSIGLQPLVREGQHPVQRDQAQEAVEQANGVVVGISIANAITRPRRLGLSPAAWLFDILPSQEQPSGRDGPSGSFM
jgi:hypothetical protein